MSRGLIAGSVSQTLSDYKQMPIRPWAEKTVKRSYVLADVTSLITRVNGAPARVEDALKSIEERYVRVRTPMKGASDEPRPALRWSPLDHAGHLLDVDELHSQRVKDFLNDVESLSVPDAGNKKTEDEHYNRQPMEPILQRFRVGRSTLANVLYGLPESAFEKESVYPKTGEKIRLLDYVEIIAEHDDHHLATIRELIWNPSF